MVIGGALLGYSMITQADPIPTPTDYDKIEIYGDCIVDKVRYLTTTLTESELDLLYPTQTFSWLPETILYAEFSNSLSAGNLSGIVNPILSWDIFRKDSTDTTYTKIGNIPVSDIEYYDYQVKGGKTYQYRIYGKSSTELSDALNTIPIYTDFSYWALMNYDNPDKVWLFDINVQSGGNNVESDMNIFDMSYTQFPVATFSEKQYITGQLQFRCGDYDSTGFVFGSGYIDDLSDFINNKQAKILKNRYGQAWKVVTSGFNFQFTDPVIEQITDGSFNFVQIGKINS